MAYNQDATPFYRIRHLCRVGDIPEAELILRLESILSKNPEVVRERDGYGRSLLHIAAGIRSVGFVKLLVELDSALLSRRGCVERLPFHEACKHINVETAKYLYHEYPESINMQDGDGQYPMQILLDYGRMHEAYPDAVEELVRFLLEHDQGAVSTSNRWGHLPLHYACRHENLVVVKLVYDSYPEAIFWRNRHGRTPLDEARKFRFPHAASFLQTQLIECVRAEQRNPGTNGQLPIHKALQNVDVSLGTIKLILQASPTSITAVDNQGFTPLHIACQVGNVELVKYIVEAHEDTLIACDVEGNLPIHIACLAGKCNVVNYFMTLNGCGISTKNGEGKLPIELFLFRGTVNDRNNIEYVEATYLLLRANPVEALGRLRCVS